MMSGSHTHSVIQISQWNSQSCIRKMRMRRLNYMMKEFAALKNLPSTTGGMGPMCQEMINRLAQRIADKKTKCKAHVTNVIRT